MKQLVQGKRLFYKTNGFKEFEVFEITKRTKRTNLRPIYRSPLRVNLFEHIDFLSV